MAALRLLAILLFNIVKRFCEIAELFWAASLRRSANFSIIERCDCAFFAASILFFLSCSSRTLSNARLAAGLNLREVGVDGLLNLLVNDGRVNLEREVGAFERWVATFMSRWRFFIATYRS